MRYELLTGKAVEQLHDFLQGQFSIYPAKEDQEHMNVVLMKLSNMQSMPEMVELAKEGSLRYFQSS